MVVDGGRCWQMVSDDRPIVVGDDGRERLSVVDDGQRYLMMVDEGDWG